MAVLVKQAVLEIALDLLAQQIGIGEMLEDRRRQREAERREGGDEAGDHRAQRPVISGADRRAAGADRLQKVVAADPDREDARLDREQLVAQPPHLRPVEQLAASPASASADGGRRRGSADRPGNCRAVALGMTKPVSASTPSKPQDMGEHRRVARPHEQGRPGSAGSARAASRSSRARLVKRERHLARVDRILQAQDRRAQARMAAGRWIPARLGPAGRAYRASRRARWRPSADFLFFGSKRADDGDRPVAAVRRAARPTSSAAFAGEEEEMADVGIVRSSRTSSRSGTRRSTARVASAMPGLIRLRSATSNRASAAPSAPRRPRRFARVRRRCGRAGAAAPPAPARRWRRRRRARDRAARDGG